MKKTVLLFPAVMAALSCGAPNLEFNPPQKIVLAVAEGESHPLVSSLRAFARLVNERSRKTMTVELRFAEHTGPDRLVLEKIIRGRADIACLSSASLGEVNEGFAALVLPYVFRDDSHSRIILHGAVGADLLASLDKQGVAGIGLINTGALHFWGSRRAVEKPADLDGFKVWSPGLPGVRRLIENAGGFNFSMPEEHKATALKRGLVDVVVDDLTVAGDDSFLSAARFFMSQGLVYVPAVLVMSRQALQKMPVEAAEFFKTCARDASREGGEALDAFKRETTSRLQKKGVIVSSPPDTRAFEKAAKEVYREQGETIRRMIDTIRNTR